MRDNKVGLIFSIAHHDAFLTEFTHFIQYG